jgi:hypothetical protein
MPFNSGLPLIDGHRLPQAVAYEQPLSVIDAVTVQTVIGGRTFLKTVRFPPPPPPSWGSKPNIIDHPGNSRVLLGRLVRTGRGTPVLASGENPFRSGIVESLATTSRACANVGGADV